MPLFIHGNTVETSTWFALIKIRDGPDVKPHVADADQLEQNKCQEMPQYGLIDGHPAPF
ncbi:MAG: hypothetical protein WCI02_05890 [Planctomycetota bacterium]|jgi:hypothetical protein